MVCFARPALRLCAQQIKPTPTPFRAAFSTAVKPQPQPHLTSTLLTLPAQSPRPSVSSSCRTAIARPRRHASTTTPTNNSPAPQPAVEQPQLTWNEFLRLRRIRRFINLGSSVIGGAAAVFVAVPVIGQYDIETLGYQMTGLDPFIVLGLSTAACGLVGWLMGPFLGSAVFGVWKGAVRREFAVVSFEYFCLEKRGGDCGGIGGWRLEGWRGVG